MSSVRLYRQVLGPKWTQSHLLSPATFRHPLRGIRCLQNRCISLRPYQEESIQAVLSHLDAGHKRLGLSLATGAGKTVIFTQLVERIKPAGHDASRTLILAHRRELVEQAYRHCKGAYPQLNVEIDMGNIHASGAADITIASVPSLKNERLDKYDPSRFKLVLVDEAHHIVAKSYLKILQHFGLVAPDSDLADEHDHGSHDQREQFEVPESSPALVGVSATFSRFDGLSLGHAIDFIVYHKDYVELIDEKWLSSVTFTTVDSKANLSKVKSASSGDFLASSLSKAVNTDITNDIVVRTWLLKAEQRRSTLVFCVDVAHVEDLQAKFLQHGIEARCVTAKTTVPIRAATVEAFRNGQFPVLLNCGIFTEGTDIPNIDCVLLARPTRSRNLLVQMIGRGMRLHSSKQDCHVIDMVSALSTGIVTVPTLFGLDPTVLLEKANASDIEALQQRPISEILHVGGTSTIDVPEQIERKVRFKDYDSVEDLLRDTSGEEHVRRISHNDWVHVGPDSEGHDRHILAGTNSAYLTVKDLNADNPRYVVLLNEKTPAYAGTDGGRRRWVPYKRSTEVAWANAFGDAIRAADTYAASSQRFPRSLVDRNQAWMRRPPSEAQTKLLQTLRGPDADLDLDKLSAGQVKSLLTRLKFGAKGQWAALNRQKSRAEKAERSSRQLEELKERETVRVGPLSQSSYSNLSHV